MLEEARRDPAIPEAWAYADPETSLAPVLPVVLEKGKQRIAMFSMISTFGTPQDVTTDKLRVESFSPADAESDALFRALAAGQT